MLTGTAIATRQSQSSQARQIRQRLESSQFQRPKPAKKKKTDDILICEGAFHLAKAIVNRLIELKYLPARVKVPLFEILTCWVRCRHAFADFSSLRRPFQPYQVLSLICLAALYIRAPLLPRDICRLANTLQIPFLTALKTVFPENFEKTEGIRMLFTPRDLPAARHVARYANQFVRGKETWPPLRRFFRGNADFVSEFQFVFDPSDETLLSDKYITSFPIGHLHITLLRITRLLGLPDSFGARVLRFTELRRTAVKMARVFASERDGPWDDCRIDEFDIDHIPSFDDPKKVFSRPLPGNGDLYGFPTDESLLVDIINAMRLCYGQTALRDIVTDGADEKSRLQLVEEWRACKDAMMNWLKYGNPEDIDNMTWTSLSQNVLASMRGKQLREYAKLADDILSERGEGPPEMWGKFISAFQSIGDYGRRFEQEELRHGDADPAVYNHVRTEETCMYNRERCGDKPSFEIAEGKAEMEQEGDAYRCERNQCGLDRDYQRAPLRSYGDFEISLETVMPGKRKRRKAPNKGDFLVEPAGIGLAWTIITKFFDGTNVVVSGTEITPAEKTKIIRLRTACDRAMEIVVKYVLGLKLRSTGTSASGVT